LSAIQLFDLNQQEAFNGTYAGGVQVARTTLTAAQVLALDSVSANVTPVPAASQEIMVLQVWTALRYGGVAYTGSSTLKVTGLSSYTPYTAGAVNCLNFAFDAQCWFDQGGAYGAGTLEYDHGDLIGKPWVISSDGAIAAGNGTLTVYCPFVLFTP
jgi:hypothetical protein